MKNLIVAFLAGGLFGAGLVVSQMTNPSKVIAFLDVFGNWDPSLALVMASALLVTFFGYRYVLKKEKPAFSNKFQLPTNKTIDLRLVTGAALFGIGWGLVGLCPGPALAIATIGGPTIIYFLTAMLGAVIIFRIMTGRRV